MIRNSVLFSCLLSFIYILGQLEGMGRYCIMLIPKKNRRIIYEYLFQEGTLVAKKDAAAPKHHDLEVPNLQVMCVMRSLKSRGLVQETFNWGWFYWFLNNEGITYLRGYLSLPEEIVPDTLKKPRSQPREGGERRGRGDRGERDRSAPREPRKFDTEKKVGAPSGDFKPDFRGGQSLGRGRGGREGYRTQQSGQGQQAAPQQ